MSKRRVKKESARVAPQWSGRNSKGKMPTVFGNNALDTVEKDNPEKEFVEGMMVYIEAHELLPETFLYDGSGEAVATVEKAAIDLCRSNTDNITRLRAIIILGHAPCKRAVDALNSFVESDHFLADTAGYALCECLNLFAMPYDGVKPEPFHQD